MISFLIQPVKAANFFHFFGKKRWEQVRNILQLNKTRITSRSLMTGIIIGLIPVVGVSSIICFLLALVFRLNHLLVQSANYLVMPLQLLFIYPLHLLGKTCLGLFSVQEMIVVPDTGEFSMFFMNVLNLNLHSLVGWGVMVVLFLLIRMIIKLTTK